MKTIEENYMLSNDPCEAISKILELSLWGVDTTYLRNYLGVTSQKLNRYLHFIAQSGLAHVTKNYCRTTPHGVSYILDYQSLPKELKN